MTIAEAREKCKGFLARIPPDMLILGVLVLTSSASFGLGYFTGIDIGQGSGITPEDSPLATMPAPGQAPTSEVGAPTGSVVASKNGTKYYPAGCAGANRISDENKVWFASVAAAANAGYALAANCK
jgi:hypothetical protein